MKRFVVVVGLTIPIALAAQQGSPGAGKPPAPVVRTAVAPGAVQPAASHAPAGATMPVADQNALVKQYCVACHNDRNKDRTSGLSFQSFDAATITNHPDTAERMIRRLRA